ncbi:hypothetical protein TIFTF001_003587 [Ficus carica]|uniref:Uncharacterized protein n=1 Tax=Ficus carica TaxID=3494 RepID=A0AA88A0U4_FICCA|nr:hypothetical protein TIFTF001_003587 [Ficus carica]
MVPSPMFLLKLKTPDHGIIPDIASVALRTALNVARKKLTQVQGTFGDFPVHSHEHQAASGWMSATRT